MSEPEAAVEKPTELRIDISPAIKHRGGEFNELVVREPTGQQQWTAEQLLKGGINVPSMRHFQFRLIALVSEWPEDAVQKLPISIIERAAAFIEGFTKAGPATGLS